MSRPPRLFPYNSRPPAPSFLLGPLSVEKRHRPHSPNAGHARTSTPASAKPAPKPSRATPSRRPTRRASQPSARASARSWTQHILTSADTIKRAGFTSPEQIVTSPGTAVAPRLSPHGDGPAVAIRLRHQSPQLRPDGREHVLRLVLIREGAVALDRDIHGLPAPPQHPLSNNNVRSTSPAPGVFALDYSTWQALISAFDITEPMIPHRDDTDGVPDVGATGWYT
ncbi:hypothetical protein MRB53_042001 [Persea americana]|nr:hypothetical protein MRB53_042001 [Persea americana]